jgi:hypothetical protein
MRLFFFVAFFASILFDSYSQRKGDFSMGPGIGLAYGGIGIQGNYQINDVWASYVGVGTTLVGVGFNLGTRFQILSNKREVYYLDFLYGYNATINYNSLNEVYYGPSFGGSYSYYTKKKKGFWNAGVLIPIRSSQFNEDRDRILRSGTVLLHFPVLVYGGFNILINK